MNPERKIKRISDFWNDGNRQAQLRQNESGGMRPEPLPPAQSQLNRRFTRQMAISVATGNMTREEAIQRCEQAHEHTAETTFEEHIAAEKGRLIQTRRRAEQAKFEAEEAKATRDQHPKLRRKPFDMDDLHKQPYSPRDVVEVLLMLAAVIVSMVLGINTVASIVMSDFGFSGSIGRARGYGAVLFLLPTFAIATASGLAKNDSKRLRLIRFYTTIGFIGLFGFIICFALAKTPIPTAGDPLDLSLDMDALEELSPDEPWWKEFVTSTAEFITEVRPLLNLPLTICMAVSEIFFAITVKSILLRKLDTDGWPHRPKAEIDARYAAFDKEYRAARHAASEAEAASKDCEESLRQATERKKRYCQEVKSLALADFLARYAEIKALQPESDD